MDGDRVPDHLWEDGGRTRPGPDHPLLVLLVHRLDAAHQPLLDERPLLAAATHLALLLASSSCPDDQLVRFLVLRTGALAERGDAPRRLLVPEAFGLCLAAAVRMVDGIHRGTANGRALPFPA